MRSIVALGVLVSLVSGTPLAEEAGLVEAGCAGGDESPSLMQGRRALGKGWATVTKDSRRQCLTELEQHKQELRQAGFDIPRDGEHIAGDGHERSWTPDGLIEGGATHLEFEFLSKIGETAGEGIVCQTGLNYGTSALAFMCASTVRVFSFDLGEHNYVNKTHELLNRRFHGRHHLTLGDSVKTLQHAVAGEGPLKAHEKCNLVFVDGGHTQDVAKADLENFARLAAPGALVVVDDCYQAGDPPNLTGWHVFVGKAFRDAVAAGVLMGEMELSKTLDHYRSVCVGRYP